MDANTKDSSPRDHVADSNPDLARKKQRYSRQFAAASGNGVLIEADEPQEVASDSGTLVEIESDNSAMEPLGLTYSLDFLPWSTSHDRAEVQLDQLAGLFHQNGSIPRDKFVYLADWSFKHLDATAHDQLNWARHYLVEESDFFFNLAALMIAFFDQNDPIDPVASMGRKEVQLALICILHAATGLAVRIVPLLPDALKAKLSRRDSAVRTVQEQRVEALLYLSVAARILSNGTPALQNPRWAAQVQIKTNLTQCRLSLLGDEMLRALSAIIRMLASSPREVKSSWVFLQNAFQIMTCAIKSLPDLDHFSASELEDTMDVLNSLIMPEIREKHPRALPPDFHYDMITFASTALRSSVLLQDRISAFQSYMRFVKSDIDALFEDSADADDVNFDTLFSVYGGNLKDIGDLFTASWILQATKSYICSGVMDVRNTGLVALCDQLRRIHERYKNSDKGFEHPTVKYAVRFLRQNQLPTYIFGAESRATIINNSRDILCFFAATGTYTNEETDIIWKACSTTVEADFVKASFSVFEHVLSYLQPRHLLYLLAKYSATPTEKLDSVALDFLFKLYRRFDVLKHFTLSHDDQLAVAFSTIDILKHVQRQRPSVIATHLRNMAMSEMCSLCAAESSADDRLQIIKRCVPDIINHTPDVTTAIEILGIFLANHISPANAQDLLSMLPISALVEELRYFLAEVDSDNAVGAEKGIIVRFEFIIRLVAVCRVDMEQSAKEELFAHVLGEDALSSTARDAAWIKLHSMAANLNAKVLNQLLKEYLHSFAPQLHANAATPHLVTLLEKTVQEVTLQNETTLGFPEMFQLPLWETLVRFARTSSQLVVVNWAKHCISELLLRLPIQAGLPGTLSAQCQAAFAQSLIEKICLDYDGSREDYSLSVLQQLSQSLDLLNFVFTKSKDADLTPEFSIPPKVIEFDLRGEERDQLISFTARVCGVDRDPQTINVTAPRTAQLSVLLAKLPEITGAHHHRIIVSGQEIPSGAFDRPLDDAGIGAEAVVMICPKYVFSMDLTKALSRPGPVEEEIIAQSSKLERVLDGPVEFAAKAYSFLKKIKPSAEKRKKIASAEVTFDEVFPRDQKWRTLLSIHVLNTHLNDAARLGLADEPFLSHSVSLLTEVLLDESRSFDPEVMFEQCRVLTRFLLARPSDKSERVRYFKDHSRFTTRVLNLIALAKDLPKQRPGLDRKICGELTLAIYRLLVEACRLDAEMLETFAAAQSVPTLHSQLLLDDDVVLSSSLARLILNWCGDRILDSTVPHVYWTIIAATLPEALAAGGHAQVFFDLASDLLRMDSVLNSDETQIRELVTILAAQLWEKHDSEPYTSMSRDKAIYGILKLLNTSVFILKGFKKSLRLPGCATKVFSELLFPKLPESLQSRTLCTQEVRNLAYDLVDMTFDPENELHCFFRLVKGATSNCIRDPGANFPGQEAWRRQESICVGLNNLGMTCYMNSLVQQLFANLPFRKFLMEQPFKDPRSPDLLSQIQLLFAKMQDSDQPMADPAALATALDVQIGSQEDVHGFYAILLARLEDCMPEMSKSTLTNFFTGKFITQIRGGCGHVSTRIEPFSDVSITVKNKASLQEGLREFVQGEPMEGANKYKCITCDSEHGGRLVDAVRRTSLEKIPDTLTFCLKRFTFDLGLIEGENKVNDKFEFPGEINMAEYTRQYFETPENPPAPDIFELTGVIVHQGSLTFGHYWSYVRLPDASDPSKHMWMYLEDNISRPCAGGIEEVQEQCFGGQVYSNGTERVDNAYVLIYQRQSYISKARSMIIQQRDNDRATGFILPRVALPTELKNLFLRDNMWRQRIGFLFDDKMHSLVNKLLEKYSQMDKAGKPQEETLSEQTQSTLSEMAQASDLFADEFSQMVAAYLECVVAADQLVEARSLALMVQLKNVLDTDPIIATKLARFLVRDDHLMWMMTLHSSEKFRESLVSLICTLLEIVREQVPDEYEDVLDAVIKCHSSFIKQPPEGILENIAHYALLPCRLVTLGSLETQKILRSKYLLWILLILVMRYNEELRAQDLPIAAQLHKSKVDYDAAYSFLIHLLSHNVNLQNVLEMFDRGNGRELTEHGWSLTAQEASLLLHINVMNGASLWTLYHVGSKMCAVSDHWEDYAPGKLVALMAGNASGHQVFRLVERTLLIYYEEEQTGLDSMLFTTLHLCKCRDEQDVQALFHQLTKTFYQWSGCEQQCLEFLRTAYTIIPRATITSVPTWAFHFLQAKNIQARQDTVQWLDLHLFNLPILSDNFPLDSSRIRATRAFVVPCMDITWKAYSEERAQTRYVQMLATMKRAELYLQSLVDEVRQRINQDGADESVSKEVMIESSEATGLLANLQELLRTLSEWAPEQATLPTRPLASKPMVEVEESEELESSDAGELSSGS